MVQTFDWFSVWHWLIVSPHRPVVRLLVFHLFSTTMAIWVENVCYLTHTRILTHTHVAWDESMQTRKHGRYGEGLRWQSEFHIHISRLSTILLTSNFSLGIIVFFPSTSRCSRISSGTRQTGWSKAKKRVTVSNKTNHKSIYPNMRDFSEYSSKFHCPNQKA